MNTWISIIIASLALIATSINAYVARSSYLLNNETQKTALFSQFQQQYNIITSRFPDRILDKKFQPSTDSTEYKRLEDYWIFCYAEWYETNKAGKGLYFDLWDTYYSRLILNAMEVESLRYVLQVMMDTYGVKRPEIQEFYNALRSLAERGGIPLTPDTPPPSPQPKTP